LDDGTGYFEVNDPSGDSAVRGNPSLRQLDITAFGTATTGSSVKVKVEVINSVSSSFSPAKSVLIAIAPTIPATSLVEKVASESDQNQLTVQFADLSNVVANGSPIISYSLEIRTGTVGEFRVYSGADGISSMSTKFTLTSPWISKGATYSFRYRAKNAVGWSEYSKITYITVVGPPGKPSMLVLSSSSSSSIVFKLPTIIDTGGADIIGVDVEYADGLSSTAFNDIPTACALTDALCSISTTDGMDPGSIYKLRFRVLNDDNLYSEYSNELKVGMIDIPTAVTTLQRVDSLSSKTQIALTWTLKPDSTAPAGVIKGYRIYMVDHNVSEDELLVYDGYGLSKKNNFIVSGLTTSHKYTFSIAAMDFNGEGTRSSDLVIYACDAPSGVPQPTLVSSTKTNILIKWDTVADTGGCPLTKFIVYRDNGDFTEASVEVIESGASTSDLGPSIHQVDVTSFPASSEGKTFKFRVRAFNSEESAYSRTSSFILAGVPETPTVPVNDAAVTSASRIGITMAIPNNGGSTILYYQIGMEIDGTWKYYTTSHLTFTVSSEIIQSKVYGFKYRAINAVGAGPYSSITYITAFGAPSTPDAPTLESASSTKISLLFSPSADDGGNVVSLYEVKVLNETDSTELTYNIDPSNMTLELLSSASDVIEGEIYTYYIRAYNDKYSDWSEGL
jgi:hypothetical protein